ncbi:MAG: UvrD-helicase domain-containing protein [Nitrospirae bacterium]|nr:UvrD-helicase domain-containing protein [Nitrospirota bacterium]MBI5696765.1 UvrD-helicase domain-containing protein [Nitrospirota bacterium]
MKFLDELNREQRQAVLHGEGPLLILAGAGSGKTKTLASRIAYLVRKGGVAPQEILAVTFTNKAAKEMRQRVEKFIGTPCRGMWVSTFHAACARMLREHIDRLGYSKSFNILDAGDAVNMVKACMKDLGISDRLYSPRDVTSRISGLKGKIVTPDEFAASAQPFGFEGKLAKIYPVYQERLKGAGVLDFDDLLMLTVQLLQKEEEVLEIYQKLFRHILVDEYQDTNQAQYRIVRLLSSKHRNVCVVGDDDQSIYSFRGADLRNILDFEKDYPEACVVTLEKNYRSTQRILDAAWSVVSNNPARKPKKLWTDSGHGEKVCFMKVADEAAEATQIAQEVKRLAREGRPFTDFAVLYRTNTQSRTIEEAFRREGVPYVVIGGMKFYDRKEVKDIVTFMKAVSNPMDSVSMKRIVNTPPRGIGEATMKLAGQAAGPDNLPLIDCLARLMDNETLSAGPKKRIGDFLAMFEGFVEAKATTTPSALAKKIIADTKYIEHLRESSGIEAQGKVDNIKELIASLEDFEKNADDPALEAYLQQVALITDWDTKKEGTPAVTMMTLHLSKGLEFPVVFITGLEEGIIPHSHSQSDDSELEEERRLLYVGMTRARERLYLMNAMTRRLAGLTQSNRVSRFLEEIPKELLSCRNVGMQRKPIATADCSPARSSVTPMKPRMEGGGCYKCGATVSHPVWGFGIVEKTEGRGEEMKVTVLFKSVGKKKLMARMANLSKG